MDTKIICDKFKIACDNCRFAEIVNIFDSADYEEAYALLHILFDNNNINVFGKCEIATLLVSIIDLDAPHNKTIKIYFDEKYAVIRDILIDRRISLANMLKVNAMVERTNLNSINKYDYYKGLKNTCFNGNLAGTKLLLSYLEKCTDKKIKRREWRDIFISAAHSSNFPLINILILKIKTIAKYGLLRECVNDGLYVACYKGNIDMVKAIWISNPDNFEECLGIACDKSFLDIIHFFLENEETHHVFRDIFISSCSTNITNVKFLYELFKDYFDDTFLDDNYESYNEIMNYASNRAIGKNKMDIFAYFVNNEKDMPDVEYYFNYKDPALYGLSIYAAISEGVPVRKFSKMIGYETLLLDIKKFKDTMSDTLNDILIKDIINIIKEYSVM